MDNTKKKKIFVIAGLAVVVIAASIVLYIVIKNTNQVDKNSQAEYGSDFVEVKKNDTLHVDRVSSKDQVINALGNNGSDVTGPESTDVLRLGDQLSQTTTYTFTLKNGKKASFNVDARTYPDKATMDAVNPFANTEPKKIAGVGDEAHWLKKATGVLQLTEPHDTLMVTKGTTSFAFQIKQPRDHVAIEKSVARNIILQVAKQASLDEVK